MAVPRRYILIVLVSLATDAIFADFVTAHIFVLGILSRDYFLRTILLSALPFATSLIVSTRFVLS